MQAIQTYLHGERELHLYPYEEDQRPGGSPKREVRPGVRAPGAGSFEFGELIVDRQGKSMVLTGRVSGTNLSYLYLELLLRDKERDVFYGPILRDYIRADKNDGSSGITRPVWGEEVDLHVPIRPQLRLLTDGAGFSLCFPLPEGYSNPGYRQGGLYTIAGEDRPFRALLGFTGEGALKRAVAYPEHNVRTGARVLTPSEGDSFAPFAQILTPSADYETWDTSPAVADTVTLESGPMRVVTEEALPGEYLVGVIAQDLDGGLTRRYVPVSVPG